MSTVPHPTHGQVIALDTFVAIEILIYTVVVGFMTYLVKEFLIKLGYYKEWHATTFYTTAYFVLVLRITEFCFFFRYYTTH